MEEQNEEKHLKKWFLLGCISPILLLIILCIGLMFYFSGKERNKTKPPSYVLQAEKKVNRTVKKLVREKHLLVQNKKKYDIDETVKAIFSIEETLKKAKDFKELTSYILQPEPDLVAPDMALLKYKFFNIYKNFLNATDDMEETKSLYKLISGTFFDLLSTFDYTMMTVNKKQAQKVWNRRVQESNLQEKLKTRLSNYQGELLSFYFDFMRTSAKYIHEWNRLCAIRDRAYLAIYENNWDEVIQAATQSVALAPEEKEAHILLAMALLEKGGETNIDRAKGLIDAFLKKHHGQEAPAYLLRGVIHLKNKEYKKAILDFDQAATYFPKQQQQLLDKLNLYKRRLFLNKSKEGRMIINIYRGIMTGAGYFSPDFQKARVYLAQGKKEMAKRKIFDHFFRRRLQGQWDRVLTDFRYSHKFLKTDLYEIFEGYKIDLHIEPAFFTNSIIVSIKNNCDKPIHNVTILLCVRFTDMFKGDYIVIPIGKTLSVVKPGETVSVGRKNISDITEEKLGETKKFKDIIEYAAILISDEAITWLEPEKVRNIKENIKKDDTDEKLAEDIKTVVKEALHKTVKETIKAIKESGTENEDSQRDKGARHKGTHREDNVTEAIKKIINKAVEKMTPKYEEEKKNGK